MFCPQNCICAIMCFLTGVPYKRNTTGNRQCKARVKTFRGHWLRCPSLTEAEFCVAHRRSLTIIHDQYHAKELNQPQEAALRLLTSYIFFGHPDRSHSLRLMGILPQHLAEKIVQNLNGDFFMTGKPSCPRSPDI